MSQPRFTRSHQLTPPWNLAVLAVFVCLHPATAGEWTESTFEDFRDGEFFDAGSNLYVSSRGRIQMIHTWDLNGDGNLDLVMPSGHGHSEKENTTIYLNLDGEIDGRSRVEIPENHSRGGFIADLDKDGFNDLVVANYSDSQYYQVGAWIYLGSAEGYASSRRVSLPGYRGTSIAGGDFNGDGWTDLALACQYFKDTSGAATQTPRSFIFWNSEDGFRESNRTELIFEGGFASAMAVGDFDRDERDDLVATGATGTFLFLSSRDAASVPEGRLEIGPAGNAAAIGDIDADGYLDLALSADGGVRIFRGTSGGELREDADRLAAERPRGVAITDVDLDGHEDVVVAHYATRGGATWTDSIIYYSDGKGFASREPLRLPTLGASGVSAGDLNGDGYPELVFSNQHVTNERSLLSYVYWNDGGTFRFGNHTQLATKGAWASAIGDVNNDRKPDVVFFNGEGGFRDGATQTHIYWGDGTRQFSLDRRITFPSHHVFGHAHADLDDDGRTDFIWCESRFISSVDHLQTGLVFYWGADSGFNGPTNLAMENAYGGVRIADINKDGYLDILAGGVIMDLDDPARHGFPIFWGSPDGYQHRNRTVIPYDVSAVRAPLLMDLNKDGWLDIASQVDLGTTTIWWGAQDGFDNARTEVIDLGHGGRIMYIKGADFNRDGWLDLFFPYRAYDHHAEVMSHLYFGSPSGYSDDNHIEIPTYIPYQNTIADFDKNGWLDLFLTSYAGEVTGNPPALVYWGEEDGLLSRPRTELPSYGSSGSATGDYDADGWLDLYVVNHRRAGSVAEPVPYIHATDAMLYWGGETGFSPQERSLLPNFGPSGLNVRDLGNSYDRGLYEDYISSPYPLAAGERPIRIAWEAETPHGSGVQFQVRAAETLQGLENSDWIGPDGSGSWFYKSGAQITSMGGDWVQYRARLTTPNGAATPYLDRVTLVFE